MTVTAALKGASETLCDDLSPSKGRPRGTTAPRGVGGFQRGQVVRSLPTVKPKSCAGRTGQVVALFRCPRPCINASRHDEIAVQMGSRTVWFRADELEPVA